MELTITRGAKNVKYVRTDGFRHDEPDINQVLDTLIARALLVYVISLDPKYTSRTGVVYDKTNKQRQQEHAQFDTILQVLARDFRLETPEGNTEFAVQLHLNSLAVVRGMLTADTDGKYRVTHEGASRSVYNCMTPEQKAKYRGA